MTTSWTAIASNTVGVLGTASVTFSSIPATYTDLVVNVSARTNIVDTEDWLKLEFNGSGGTAYSDRVMWGNGTSAPSASESGVASVLYGGMVNASTSTSNTFSNCLIYIPNYAGSTNKSFSSNIAEEQKATKAFNAATAGLWSNTAAITSLKLTPSNAGLIVQYSTFTLFGIKNS